MCGLAGYLGHEEQPPGIAVAMGDAIRHRGPDDSGIWLDEGAGIGLAHRRLSILDLSPAGHQPMVSPSGRWVIAFNGEIYNHVALRRELEQNGSAPVWRGHSDTETLLAAIEAWGVDRTLRYSVGMFAMALWDRTERSLWLARDRIGEKPLYYGWQGSTFLFGSELAALRVHPAFSARIDRSSLSLLLRHNYVPAPYSIFEGIRKLPPATWLKVSLTERNSRPIQYWSLAETAVRGVREPFAGSEQDAIESLERLLGDAVEGQMASDVPLGSLLSGGIDSTLVTALMQVRSDRPIRTFTIGFEEEAYDESGYARAIAQHLGTDHTELKLSGRDALSLVPELPRLYDEPFADSSQLPTHLVMRLARKSVTVALSGDGGDEFFGGYNRYLLAPRLWQRIRMVPSPLRVPLLRLATCVYARSPTGLDVAQVGDKLARLTRLFAAKRVDGVDDLYAALVSEWDNPANVVLGGSLPTTMLDERDQWPALVDPAERMMALDALTYLPGDVLAKVDRAAMAISLETRAPFLDRDVMEFAWTLPISMKLRKGRGKWILRQVLRRHVPDELMERPKMGFGIPLDQWLRGPLRDWAEALLDAKRLREDGFFDVAAVRRTWEKHIAGREQYGYRLWSVLMFQAWTDQSAQDRPAGHGEG